MLLQSSKLIVSELATLSISGTGIVFAAFLSHFDCLHYILSILITLKILLIKNKISNMAMLLVQKLFLRLFVVWCVLFLRPILLI